MFMFNKGLLSFLKAFPSNINRFKESLDIQLKFKYLINHFQFIIISFKQLFGSKISPNNFPAIIQNTVRMRMGWKRCTSAKVGRASNSNLLLMRGSKKRKTIPFPRRKKKMMFVVLFLRESLKNYVLFQY